MKEPIFREIHVDDNFDNGNFNVVNRKLLKAKIIVEQEYENLETKEKEYLINEYDTYGLTISQHRNTSAVRSINGEILDFNAGPIETQIYFHTFDKKIKTFEDKIKIPHYLKIARRASKIAKTKANV